MKITLSIIVLVINIACLIFCLYALKKVKNEQPCTVEEPTPKPEAPKRKHVTTVSGRYHEVWGRIYRVKCSDCAWLWDSYSAKTAEAEGAAHERRNA